MGRGIPVLTLKSPPYAAFLITPIAPRAPAAFYAGHHLAGAGRHLRDGLALPQKIHRRGPRGLHGADHTHPARLVGGHSVRGARRFRTHGVTAPREPEVAQHTDARGVGK